MKKIYLAIILILISSTIFTISYAAEIVVASKSCEEYKNSDDKDFNTYCTNINKCQEKYNPSDKGINMLKIQIIPFLPVKTISGSTQSAVSVDSNGELYKKYFQEISLGFAPYVSGGPLEQAKVAYLETQNAVYNCAVLNTKIKVGENVIKLMTDAKMSNQTQKIITQNESMRNELKKRNCNTVGDKTEPNNKVLLQNITFHYCNYRLYLNYLSKYSIYNISPTTSVSSKVKSAGQDKYDTNKAYNNVVKQTNLVSSEIKHTKDVYNMSFNGFNELEATYGSHIMLQLIYDDYTQMRDNLAKLLSPLSQLAYKIPNAQKQK